VKACAFLAASLLGIRRLGGFEKSPNDDQMCSAVTYLPLSSQTGGAKQILKQQADEKRRAERRAWHMQDDLRYGMKKLPELLDVNLGYEGVRVSHNVGYTAY